VLTAVDLGGNVCRIFLCRGLQLDQVSPWLFVGKVNQNLRLELVLHAPILLCLLGADTSASLCAILIFAALRFRAHARGAYLLDTMTGYPRPSSPTRYAHPDRAPPALRVRSRLLPRPPPPLPIIPFAVTPASARCSPSSFDSRASLLVHVMAPDGWVGLPSAQAGEACEQRPNAGSQINRPTLPRACMLAGFPPGYGAPAVVPMGCLCSAVLVDFVGDGCSVCLVGNTRTPEAVVTEPRIEL
jgi:hypothetical protein